MPDYEFANSDGKSVHTFIKEYFDYLELEEGVLSPANYIEDMKLAGMIDKLDFYIFEKTCKMLADWKNTDFKKLYLSCNFTRTTLSQPTFLEEFEEALSKYDFDRKNLLIELTEDALVSDSSVA